MSNMEVYMIELSLLIAMAKPFINVMEGNK